MDETTPISPKDKSRGGSDSQAVYYGKGQSPGQKMIQLGCMVIVTLAVLLCLSLCIYRGVVKKISHIAFLYFMFAASTVGVAIIHILMVVFMKKGYITEGKIWFSYISSFLLVVQTVFIDVIIFS